MTDWPAYTVKESQDRRTKKYWMSKSMTSEPDIALQRILIAELKGIECRCGSTKKPMMTFCYHCYSKLPRVARNALYRRIGEGYEASYQVAVEALGL